MSFNKTFGLGGMSLVLVGLLMLSGALMLLVYKPVPQEAYQSVLSLRRDYIFGSLIRNIHFFSANLLVVLMVCHMLRVVFTLGYIQERRSNWFIGICLLGLILFSCFTGYLLPWDQTAYWAVTICIHMLDYVPFGTLVTSLITDGDGVTAQTLQVFFTCHTTLIPATLLGVLCIHFWKIRKVGGVIFNRPRSLKSQGKRQMVPAWPNLFLREAVVGLCLVAFIMSLSLLFDAPLEKMANSGLSPNPAKAPWYFAGFQELLLHFHPIFAVCIIPALAFGLLSAFPLFSKPDERSGTWFISAKGARAAIIAAVSAFLLTPGFVMADAYVLQLHTGKILLGSWILFTVAAGGSLIFYSLLRKKWRFSVNEANQTLIAFFISAYVMLTITCVWFRGAGMALEIFS